MELQEVIGSYIKDNTKHDYTKEMLKGDIALLTLEMTNILIEYMNENGYQDVYITPLITKMTNTGIEFTKQIS